MVDPKVSLLIYGTATSLPRSAQRDPGQKGTAYCRTFMDSLSDVQDFRQEQMLSKADRLAQAVSSLRITLSLLDKILSQIHTKQPLSTHKILKVINTTKDLRFVNTPCSLGFSSTEVNVCAKTVWLWPQ